MMKIDEETLILLNLSAFKWKYDIILCMYILSEIVQTMSTFILIFLLDIFIYI